MQDQRHAEGAARVVAYKQYPVKRRQDAQKPLSLGSNRVDLVSIDLRNRDVEVFEEKGTCSFDLVAHRQGDLVRIEVKGAGNKNHHSDRYDVLAKVHPDSAIEYVPSLRAYFRHQTNINILFQDLIGSWKPPQATTKKVMEAAQYND